MMGVDAAWAANMRILRKVVTISVTRQIGRILLLVSIAAGITASARSETVIPPVLVGWQWSATGPTEYIAETAATSNIAHIGGPTDEVVRDRVQKAARYGLKSAIGIQRYLFRFQQLKQKDQDGRPHSALRADYRERLSRLWSLLGASSLQDSVIVFALTDEPYAHLRDLGIRWQDSAEARQLHKDIDDAIAFVKRLAPGRLTLIAFASGELLAPEPLLQELVIPPDLDLIGIDCYMRCPGANLSRIYARVIQAKRPHQKLAPTFSAGRRAEVMTAAEDKAAHADILEQVWKPVIAQYPGETRYYFVNAYQTALREPGNFRENTYGAMSMPNTFRAYNIFMSGLLGRTPDLSPRCALSVYPPTVPVYRSANAARPERSANLYWIATDAERITLSDGHRNLGDLSPPAGGSIAVSPEPGVTTYRATVIRGNATSTCEATLKVTQGPSPRPFSNIAPNNREHIGAGKVVLRWQPSDGVDHYEVYVGHRRAPTDQAPKVTTKETSFVLENVAPNTTYFWQIKAVNKAGATSSRTWNFRTREGREPPQR